MTSLRAFVSAFVACGIGIAGCSSAPASETTSTSADALLGSASTVEGSILRSTTTANDARIRLWFPDVTNVVSIRAIDSTTFFFLDTSARLWRKVGSITDAAPIATNVKSFQAVDANTVFLLDGNSVLWRVTSGVWTVVSGAIASFQIVDADTVFMIEMDRFHLVKKTLSTGAEQSLAYGALEVQAAIDAPRIMYILLRGGSLFRTDTHSNDPGLFTPIETNVASFRALDSVTYYVRGTDEQLWHETNTNRARTWVDATVATFAPVDAYTAFVLGTDGKLWRETFSMNSRNLVAVNVKSFHAVSASYVYVLDNNSNVWRMPLGTPSCNLQVKAESCDEPGQHLAAGYPFTAAWGVSTTATSCLDIAGAGGTWKAIVPDTSGEWFKTDVPTAYYHGDSPDCGSRPGELCCTYVWWPSNTTTPAAQDPSVLCAGAAHTVTALQECGSIHREGVTDPSPGGGGCDTCEGPQITPPPCVATATTSCPTTGTTTVVPEPPP